MFTTSGLSEGNSHELVNPAIRPLGVLPGALKLPHTWHGDAGSSQTDFSNSSDSKVKVKVKVKGPNIFKSMGFKDIEYDIPVYQM